MKKKLSVLLIVVAVFSLVGCKSEGGTDAEVNDVSENPQYETVTLNVAYMPNYGSLVEVVTAIEMGYMEEQGINVELVEFADGPTIIEAMENGSIDVGYIGSGAHKLCINGAAKIFCFAHVGNGDRVMGLKSKGINSIADMKGKTIAYSAGTSSESILNFALATEGMTISDVKAMEMDASGIVNAMVSGSVDGAALWSPGTLQVLNELGSDVVELADNLMFADQAASISSWICMSDYADNNEDVLVRFTKALMNAKDYRSNMGNAEQISGWIADRCGLDKNAVYDQRGDAEWLSSDDMMKEINDGTIEKLYMSQQHGFIEAGAVKAEVPVSDYVLFDIMKAAK